ncbi:zinc ribbon domain-containing protein [Candidatus Riflebacteria bacterium]
MLPALSVLEVLSIIDRFFYLPYTAIMPDNSDLINILELAEHDEEISRVEKELLEVQGKIAKLKARFEQESSTQTMLKKEQNRIDRALKEEEAHEKELENTLAIRKNALLKAADPKSAELLEKEVNNLLEKRGELDEKILILMEEKEEIDKKVEHESSVFKGEDKFIHQRLSEYEEKIKEIQNEKKELQIQRNPIVEEISAGLYRKYMDIKTSVPGGNAIAYLETGNDFCSGCGMRIPSTIINRIEAGQLDSCPSCHRLLFWRA